VVAVDGLVDALDSVLPAGAAVVVTGRDATAAAEVARASGWARVALWLDPSDHTGLRAMLAELFPGAAVRLAITSPELEGLA